MGAGDELMAAGHARRVWEQSGRRVVIEDSVGRHRWHPLWEGLPWIISPQEPVSLAHITRIRNGSQCRPYIHSLSADSGWIFNTDWRARDHIGAISFNEPELELARSLTSYCPYIVVEPSPTIKNPNRQWLAPRWQGVILRLRQLGYSVLQPFHQHSQPFAGATAIPTSNFREAAAMLRNAALYIGVEGGLTHAAAALNCHAVVLYGGCIPVDILGYPQHYNIVDEGEGSPCGRWVRCEHCVEAWNRITVDHVMARVREWREQWGAVRASLQVDQSVLAEMRVGSALH